MPAYPADFCDTLDLPGGGTLTASVTILEHGRMRYTVRGAHIRGTVVVIPEALENGTVLPCTVTVQYGDGTGPHGDFYSTSRPDELTVNNVRLHGWTSGINPDAPPTSYFLGQYATTLRRGENRELRSGTRRRTEVVLRAIVGHWSRLPHRRELETAAARHMAAEFAVHEAGLAAQLEAEAEALQDERARVRRRLNVINGVLRRRPRSIRPADPTPVKVPLVDNRGAPMGVVRVREIAVNEGVSGTVVYEVAGARVCGRFTVGGNQFRPGPIPDGIRIVYGHARSRFANRAYEHEPTVNGVRLSGLWDHDTSCDITRTAPAYLPAQRDRGPSISQATEQRASAVLRALAVRYLHRSDAEALRLAAAKDHAPQQRAATRAELRELRVRQRDAEARGAHHRNRERQYSDLLAYPAPIRQPSAVPPDYRSN